MKPTFLKIKGLNSFIETQIIDFSKLTQKGFFGIFGPTGSGKSSILDAITIALYGKITRDNKGYINTESDRLEVSYKFQLGLGGDKKEYLCDRCVKVDKKGAYKTTLARICRVDGEKVEVLAEGAGNVKNKVEEIVGLSADDFTRSVVLPQGKFSEFLKLTGIERRSMLERIFKLEKYGRGLRDRIRKLKDKQEKLLIEINGKLSRYDDVSKENLDNIKEQLKALKEQEEKLKVEKNKVDDLFQEYKVLWEFQNELDMYKNQYEKIIEKQDEIKEETIRLNHAKNAINVKPFMESTSKTKESIVYNTSELKKVEINLNNTYEGLRELEKNYSQALKIQKEKIPELIRFSTELDRVLEVNKKVEQVKKERNNLAKVYKKITLELSGIDKSLKEVSENKEELTKTLGKIEIDIINKSISPKYRETIQRAYEKFVKYRDLSSKISILNFKIEKAMQVLDKSKKDFKNAEDMKKNKGILISNLIKDKETLEKNCPGNNELLLKAQQDFNNIQEKYGEALKNIKIKEDLQKKHSEILLTKNEVQKKLEDSQKEYEKNYNKLEENKKNIDRMVSLNMAGILSEKLEEGIPCPVCGSTHHVKRVELIDENEIHDLKVINKKIEQDIEEFKEIIGQFKIKRAEISKDEEHIINDLYKMNENLKHIDIKILGESKEESKQSFKLLKYKIDRWNEDIINVEKSIDICKEEKGNIDNIYAALEEKIIGNTSSLNNLKEDKYGLSDEWKKLHEEYQKLIKKLDIDDVDKEVNQIKIWDEELVSLKGNEKDLRQNIDKLNLQKEALQEKISNLETERIKTEQSGKEKKLFIDEYQKEVKDICGDNKPEELIFHTKKTIQEINDLEHKLKLNLDSKNNEKENCEKEKISLEKNADTLKKLFKDQEEDLNNKLKENGFENEEEIIKYIMSKGKIDNLQNKIDEYQDRRKNIQDNIKRITSKLKDRCITNKEWEEVQLEKERVQESLSKNTELKAQKEKELTDREGDLNKVKDLIKLKGEFQHKLSLYEELDNLVKGNKFVEFVAMNELRYIAMEASKRLKSITRGRYALEIDNDGNFIMRDDFNGGTRRNTSTLSGGETFLTSLSLSLALSSQIQLKGSAPLQFFFLDEGFGSLDSQLLDVVMTSLEKLRSEKLCVGIISHVEELKNRVPVKLIVTPASSGGNGTVVKIEYS